MARNIRFPVEELNELSFTLEGDVDVQVDVTETSSGDLEFTLRVLDGGDNIGDLRGFFFDFGDPDIVGGLEASGDDVSGAKFAPGQVDNLGKGNTMKGLKSDDGSDFDGGIAFGNPGKGQMDDVQETTFTLSHPDIDLSLDDLANMDFGLRLTSVGEPDGPRDASLKMMGEMPDHEAPDDLATQEAQTTDDADTVDEDDDLTADDLAELLTGSGDGSDKDEEEQEDVDVPDFDA